MPRPDTHTPLEPLVNTLRATASWCVAHRSALLEVADAAKLEGLEALGDALEEASNAFEREKRDAVDLTVRRDALLLTTRQLLTAAAAAIRLHHEADPKAAHATTRRFVQSAPSSVRTLDAAQRAANRLISACEGSPSGAGRATTKLRARADALRQEVRALQGDYAREGQEYSQSSDHLDTTRTQALKRLVSLQLAAEAVAFEDPQPLNDLRALFSAHNPAPTNRSTADDLLEDDDGLGDASEPHAEDADAQ